MYKRQLLNDTNNKKEAEPLWNGFFITYLGLCNYDNMVRKCSIVDAVNKHFTCFYVDNGIVGVRVPFVYATKLISVSFVDCTRM